MNSAIFIVLVSVVFVNGKYAEDEIDSTEDWVFLTRFCFLSGQGLTYDFEYPVEYAPINLLLYWDKPGLWESVYKTDLSCQDKEDKLSRNHRQIITLDISDLAGCSREENNTKVKCTYSLKVSTARERWWYLTLGRCGQTNRAGIKMKYWIHMTNGEKGDYLHRELSADEFYILPIDIAFLLVYVVLCILSVICAVILRSRLLFHTTYKLFMAALFIWTFYLFIMCIGYGIYGNDGLEEKLRSTKVAARVFQAISTLIFLAMLLLMAHGYTITQGRLSTMATMMLTIFFTLYAVSNAIMLVWEAIYFDPGLVLYIYESPPGFGLIVLRLIGWIWFIVAVFLTLKASPRKKLFYIPFFIFYTIWFWAGPIVILVAMFAMSLHTREKTVVGVENFVAFCGHVFFLILTRPQAANNNFPYHVRTTQIGILTPDEEDPGDTNLNSFSAAPYVVTDGQIANGTAPNFSHFITSSFQRNYEETDSQKALYNNNNSSPSSSQDKS